MSEERSELGRRKLLVLGMAATVYPACGGDTIPLGGPYGGSYSPGTGGTDAGGGITFPNGSGSGTGTTTPPSSGTGTSTPPSSGSGSSTPPGSGPGSGTGTTGSGSGTHTSGTGSAPGSSTGSGSGSSPSSCPTSNTYVADFASNPGLKTVGSGVTVSPPGYSDSYGNDAIYVVQESAGTYIAYSLSCTHAGCQINQSGSGWRCPCHGATFSATGAHQSGPGHNLQTYPTCADANGVTITLS